MWSKAFWKAQTERTVATFAEIVLALAGVDSLKWVHLEWDQIFIAAGIGAGLATLKGLVTAKTTDGSPSIGNVEKLAA